MRTRREFLTTSAALAAGSLTQAPQTHDLASAGCQDAK